MVLNVQKFPALQALDGVVEEQLIRVDELSTMLDAVRDASKAIDSSYPMLLASTQVFALECVRDTPPPVTTVLATWLKELLALFRAIDASEEAVGRVLAAVNISSERWGRSLRTYVSVAATFSAPALQARCFAASR